jgi:hypothetical protein
MRWVRARELHVCAAASCEALCRRIFGSALHDRTLELRAQDAEALLRDGSEDRLAVGEVVIWRLVAHPGAASDLAHAERTETFDFDQLDARAENALSQRARIGHRAWVG